MHITIIGTGFVGVVSSAVFSSFGNTVFGLDVDEKKVSLLNQSTIPFYEPGLENLVQEQIKKGTLQFTTDYNVAISDADVVMIAVGTPSAPDGQANLSYVFACAQSMAPYLKSGAIVAIKSTVPPGTCQKVSAVIQEKISNPDTRFHVVSLPEFLKEGTAVEDTLHPDRVIIGAEDELVIATLKELHKPLNAPFIVMKPESAQMCKYTANSYLATRITFINQIANLCEVNGANIYEVIDGIGLDRRIGKHYWYPGLGYGGSCFPKDVKELAAYAKAVGQPNNLMVTIDQLNEERIPSLVSKFEQIVGTWESKNVAVLGLSFKPNTDDMREAPSTKLIPLLVKKGAIIHAYDPMANESAKAYFKGPDFEHSTVIHDSIASAVQDIDVVILLVEWPQLITMDLSSIAEHVHPNAVFIDCRDQYTREHIEQAGFTYIGIGV